MPSSFNLTGLKKETSDGNRYDKRLAVLINEGQETERIKKVIEEAFININKNQCSFVIYGEPQSGKTEMMIALAAKALDEGCKIVVVLLNDSVQLLGQNLDRFQRSGLSPTPKKFSEVLPAEVVLGDNPWVIFCKKNAKDLEKLIEKLRSYKRKLIIDDEADYATPNSKINRQELSRVNELTGRLIGDEGIYIGVTATPARLDLNRTHANQNEYWIDLPPHQNYIGQDIFFPATVDLSQLRYRLNLLSDEGDSPSFLRDALFSYLVNVAFLNTRINPKEVNYSFLIHTSGRKDDHTRDYKAIQKIFAILREKANPKHEQYYREIWTLAKERYAGHEDKITKYIIETNPRNNIVVMNSDKEKNVADNRTATSPSVPFTIVIGGNIISRGVTFNNLLSMFFTRDVKHRMQQDTYIQRARMFGSRNEYLQYFELSIPKSLFLTWQQCFIFHRLSLESRRAGSGSPVWIEGDKIISTGSSGVYKARVIVDKGEMSFDIFKYNEEIVNTIWAKSIPMIGKLRELSDALGKDKLPIYLLNYIEQFCPNGDSSIAFHHPRSIANYDASTTDVKEITRTKGFIGEPQLEVGKYPLALHHLYILFNAEGYARVFYKYKGDIRFLKTRK